MGRHAASSSDMYPGALTRPSEGNTRCVCRTPSSGRPSPVVALVASTAPVMWPWLKMDSTRSPTSQAAPSPAEITVPHMSEQGTSGALEPASMALWWP